VNVLLTGADGFVGVPAARTFESRGHHVRRVVRRSEGPGSVRFVVSDLTASREWPAMLRGVDAVVHLAGRAHVLREQEANPQAAFDRANVELTRELALACAQAGVRRFVFASSIGVNGNSTHGTPYRESDAPAPDNPYARSKLAAEQALRELERGSALEVVIARPPLIYGPRPKGNLLRMLKLVASGIPLPLASVRNRRNVIGIDNLCDALVCCVESEAAAGETFLLAEPEPRSTADMFRALYRGMRRHERLFRCPELVLRTGARLAGVSATYEKLCGSLEIDASKAHRLLDWNPKRPFEDGMREVAQWYVDR
jgi:nucleoside-diphosphate-sugar epimerase